MKRSLTSALLVAALLPLSGLATDYQFTANSTIMDIPHGTAVTWGLNNTNGKNVTTNSTTTAYTNLFNDINTSGKVITSASLTLTNIYDWTGETNTGNGQYDPADALFINLLCGVYSGNTTGLSSKIFDSAGAGRIADVNWNNAVNPFVDVSSTTGDWNDILQTGTPLAFQDAVANSLLKVTSYGNGGNQTKVGTPTQVSWSDPTGGVASTLVITFSTDNLAVLRNLLDLDSGTGSPNVGLGFAAECHYYMDSAVLSITTGNGPPPPSVPDSGSTLALMGLAMTALVAFRRFQK